MNVTRPAARGLSAALLAAAVAAACSEPITSTPQRTRNMTAPAMSRVGIATTDEHEFVLKGEQIPANFTARVAARGGEIVSAQFDIGVVVTRGLSDVEAASLAGTDSVARDYIGRWVPTPDEMRASTAVLPTAIDATSAQPPFAAAFLPLQWNMREIHAPEAWARRSGNLKVKVAILDSGLDPDHLDQNGIIDVASSVAFVPSVTGPPAWADDNLHGTFVGGIVTSNNFGTAGVAPDVTLIAVKVLGANGVGPIGAVIDGIVYATKARAQVINMSLGLYLKKDTPAAGILLSAMTRAVNYAKRHGVLVVSAAGNENKDLEHDKGYVELPCEAGVQICVSATAPGDTRTTYSNYGRNAIDVAAPGGDGPPSVTNWILGPCSSHVADPAFAGCKNRVTYILAAGTSASAPHVSGLGAYLDAQFGGHLDASLLIPIIERTADDIGPRGPDPYFGNGRINVAKALAVGSFEWDKNRGNIRQ